MTIVDTSVLINFINGQTKAISAIKQLKQPYHISAITLAEVQIGFLLQNQPDEETLFQNLVDNNIIKVLPLEPKAASIYADFQAKFIQSGNKFPGFDGLIAATCLANNASLLTSDHHFPKIPHLKVILIDALV